MCRIKHLFASLLAFALLTAPLVAYADTPGKEDIQNLGRAFERFADQAPALEQRFELANDAEERAVLKEIAVLFRDVAGRMDTLEMRTKNGEHIRKAFADGYREMSEGIELSLSGHEQQGLLKTTQAEAKVKNAYRLFKELAQENGVDTGKLPDF